MKFVYKENNMHDDNNNVAIIVSIITTIVIVTGVVVLFRYLFYMPDRYVQIKSIPGVGEWYCESERKEQWGELKTNCFKREDITKKDNE